MNLTIAQLKRMTPASIRKYASTGVMINTIQRRGVSMKDAPAVHSTGDRCRAYYCTTAISEQIQRENRSKSAKAGKPYA
jgi:hypothetical protein